VKISDVRAKVKFGGHKPAERRREIVDRLGERADGLDVVVRDIMFETSKRARIRARCVSLSDRRARGVLHRRRVTPTSETYIGKETNKLENYGGH
jgi:hypothetical protein